MCASRTTFAVCGVGASMIVDTDVLIRFFRGNPQAAQAAQAVEANHVLLSANTKHFNCVNELQLKPFRP